MRSNPRPTNPPCTLDPAEIIARFARAGDGSVDPTPAGPSLGLPGLELGAIHEWFAQAPPLGLLAGLGRRAERRGGRVVWIGRGCWGHPAGPGRDDAKVMPRRAVFVDPPGDAERLWAIDQALRCRGVACVIADGSRLEMAASRRLQLAARAGGVLGLLARPPDELGELSAARTRWRAEPAPNLEARWFPEPAWTLELLRCKGLRPTTDARRWTVRVNHDTGDVAVVPDAADRRVATPRPPRTA